MLRTSRIYLILLKINRLINIKNENFSGRSRQNARTVTQKIRDERGDGSQTERILQQASDIFASELKSIEDGLSRDKRGRTGGQGLESDEGIRVSLLSLPQDSTNAVFRNNRKVTEGQALPCSQEKDLFDYAKIIDIKLKNKEKS